MEKTDFKQVLGYAKKVFGEGWKDTVEFYWADWKNSLGNIFIGIVSAFALPNLLNRIWGIMMPDTLPQTLSAIGSGVIGFLSFAGLLLFLNIAVFTPARLWIEQKKKADLYTMSDIEIEAFESSEADVRPAGILVTNKKGVPVKCDARINRLWKGQVEITEHGKDYSLFHYGDGLTKYPGFASLENEVPELFILQRIIKPSPAGVIDVTVPRRGEDSDKKSVYLELQQNLEIINGYTYVAEVVYKFKVQETYIDPPPYRFMLKYNNEKLVVKKI